jgi:phosphatidylserine/phosphatidylglycerophosphate/cardiolipin synthase-like enzyme
MRTPVFGNGIRVRAIAGTHTVLFALDVDKASRKDLLGFAIQREEPAANQRFWLKGLKVFPSVVPRPRKGVRYTTLEQPIQSLLWGDYTAKPARDYVFTIRPVLGAPKNLTYGEDIIVPVKTESDSDAKDVHNIFFNRGAVASQFYAETFDNKPPPEPDNPAHPQTVWLSRGLLDGCLTFIKETKKGEALRVAAYEFSYAPVLNELKSAIDRKVDVQIVYEAGKTTVKGKQVETEATVANKKAIKKAALPADNLIKRTNRKNIPHNKFIVRLDKTGKPVAVWTGSTNFTPSGFLGQTNVGHRMDHADVAATYLKYWGFLAEDPLPDKLKPEIDDLTPQPGDELAASTTTCVFSPRSGTKMLDWYADRIRGSSGAVMFTGGFGVNDKLAEAIAEDRDFLRFLILENPPTKKTRKLLGNDRDIIVVYGNVLGDAYRVNKTGELTIRKEIPGFALTKWFFDEEHFRKAGHIFFVHTKILIVDPLSDDPLVFTGSANFSPASLRDNDENMLLIRGDKRVADIYMTELDRILRHFYFRDVAAQTADEGQSGEAVFLKEKPEDWLNPYFQTGRFKDRRRRMFFPGTD